VKEYLVGMAVCSALCIGNLSAAPILVGPVASCLSFGSAGSNVDDVTVPYSVFSAPNFACEQQDKIFSNFNVGLIPTSSALRFQLQTIGPLDFHTLTLNGNFGSAFAYSYDIAIDQDFGGPGANALERIVRVSGDISNPVFQGNPSNLKRVSTSAAPGTVIGSLTSTIPNPGTPIALSEVALHVADAYTPGGGAVVSISNTFLQVGTPNSVPEPLTYTLFGGGFLLLASIRRFRRSS